LEEFSIDTEYKVLSKQVAGDYIVGTIAIKNIKGRFENGTFDLNDVPIKFEAYKEKLIGIELLQGDQDGKEEEYALWFSCWNKEEEKYELIKYYTQMIMFLKEGNAEAFCSRISEQVHVTHLGKLDKFPWFNATMMKEVFRFNVWRDIQILRIVKQKDNTLIAWFKTHVCNRKSGLCDIHINIHWADFDKHMKLIILDRIVEHLQKVPKIDPPFTMLPNKLRRKPASYLFVP